MVVFALSLSAEVIEQEASVENAIDQSNESVSAEKEFIQNVQKQMHPSSSKEQNTNVTPTRFSAAPAYARMFFTLLIVILIIMGLYYLLKKKVYAVDETDTSVVLSNHILAPGRVLQIVYAGGKYLILGVTSENINLVGEITDPKEIERLELVYANRKNKKGDTFGEIMQNLLQRVTGKTTEKQTFDYEADSVDFLREQRERIKKINEE